MTQPSAAIAPPTPFGALPTPRQLSWQAMEMIAFVHFTTNTFTDLEWGYGDESPAIFNPTDLDVDQIVGTTARSGFKGLVLTCKHHDGFCLWPSAYTEHSVKNSPWKDGKGDMVREFADACKTHGIKFGTYLSPWDRNHALYGTPAYIEYFRNQLRELCSNYGPLYEVWFDGANGGDGYYGGARERRAIDNTTYYDWPSTVAIVRELQPDAVMFSDGGPDVRWMGNEEGHVAETCWTTIDATGYLPGVADSSVLYTGTRHGSHWMPPEVDTSIRPGWFYHDYEDDKVKSLARLTQTYFESHGRGGNLMLNLPPDRRGRLHERDVEVLREWRAILDATFSVNLAATATVTASDERGAEFAAANALGSEPSLYWATVDGVTTADLTLEFDGPVTFNVFEIREHIALGQRIDTVAVDVWDGQSWSEWGNATSVGYKRLILGPEVAASKVRVRIDAAAPLAVSGIGIYSMPLPIADPVVSRLLSGDVVIAVAESSATTRYTVDGSEPRESSPVYATPLSLQRGGTVKARAYDAATAGRHSAIVTGSFGLAKGGWAVVSPANGATAIDEDSATILAIPASDPLEVVLDLGRSETIAGITVLPRQDGNPTGIPSAYAVSVSDSLAFPDASVATGEFSNIRSSPNQRTITFARPVTGRYVRFAATRIVDDGDTLTVAEIGVLAG